MSFGGAIRPLPGQPGYGQRESDKLAEETREMQINLMKLQEQMNQNENLQKFNKIIQLSMVDVLKEFEQKTKITFKKKEIF